MIEVCFVCMWMWMWHSCCKCLIAWVTEWVSVCVHRNLNYNGLDGFPRLLIFFYVLFLFSCVGTRTLWVIIQMAISSVSSKSTAVAKLHSEQTTANYELWFFFYCIFAYESYTFTFNGWEPPSLFSKQTGITNTDRVLVGSVSIRNIKYIKCIYMFSSLIFSVYSTAQLTTNNFFSAFIHTSIFHIHDISISIPISILICGFFDPIFNLFYFILFFVFDIACVHSTVCVENYWFKFKTDVVVQSARVLSQLIQIVSKTDKTTECDL